MPDIEFGPGVFDPIVALPAGDCVVFRADYQQDKPFAGGPCDIDQLLMALVQRQKAADNDSVCHVLKCFANGEVKARIVGANAVIEA